MARVHRPTPELPQHLRRLYERFPFDRSLAEDPLGEVRRLAPEARSAEILGLYAATLALGNTTAIRGSIRSLVDRAGGDVATLVRDGTHRERLRAWGDFRHRWIRGDQMAFLGDRLAALYASYDSLEALFLEGAERADFAGGIDAIVQGLRGPGSKAPPGVRALLSSPLESPHSAAKRLTLYLRWMVRPSYPDLGVWARIPTGELRIPLDQHVHWIAYHLGMTQRRTRSWRTVEEVTETLRRIDPIDPIRFDFVLCHTGISGDCPKERDLAVCGPCAVRPDCLLWRRARRAS